MEENNTLIMTEEFWRNSQLSIARFYGGIKLGGKEYVIVDKTGRDLFETSIPPGEPADLIAKSLQPAYKKLGRDKVIELVKQGKNEKEIIELVKEKKKKVDNTQKTLEL